MIDETKLKNVVDSSPKILHFLAIDEKLRVALLETELFNCTQTEID